MPFYFVFYFWLLAASQTPIRNISRSNQLIREAENAFQQKNYIVALVKYRYLYNSIRLKDKYIQLNLAHCYYINKDTAQAKKFYIRFTEDAAATVRAVANQQLGVLAYQQANYASALEYFKKALQAIPENDTIRFNYELAKRMESLYAKASPQENKKPEQTSEVKKQEPAPVNPAETSQDSDPQERPQESDQQAQAIQERLRRINLSQEKADVILDAMKNNEIQYIQQKKRTSNHNQEKMYPDW